MTMNITMNITMRITAMVIFNGDDANGNEAKNNDNHDNGNDNGTGGGTDEVSAGVVSLEMFSPGVRLPPRPNTPLLDIYTRV